MNKIQDQMNSQEKPTKHLKKKLVPILLKLFLEIEEELFVWGQHHTNTKNKDITKKEPPKSRISRMDIDGKILNKILANQIQLYLERVIHHDQVGFIQWSKDVSIFANQSVWYTTFKDWRMTKIWSSQ